MNFVEFICDRQRNLTSQNYENMIWAKIRDSTPMPVVTLEDEELYRNHIPIDFPNFLRNCVTKLREVKMASVEVNWSDLDNKYLSTLVHFALEQETINLYSGLYAANLFALINIVHPSRRFFYKLTFLKVLEVLKEFNRSQNINNSIIIFLMDDLKLFFTKVPLPEDVVVSTISVLHGFTYCCDEVFEDISLDVSFENLGYIAFVNLKVLVEQLSKQRNNDKRLFPIVIALTSSLKSSATNNLSTTVKIAHQRNVRLFIKQNFGWFCSTSFCLVIDMLKFVCLSSDFDEYDAIAQLIQQLPCELNQTFITFFEKSMLCEREDFRKNLLNLVLPILRHPAEHETKAKRIVRAEIFLNNVIILLAEKDEEIRARVIKILAEASEDSLGRRVLRKVMAPQNYDDINRDTIQNMLYSAVDKNWSKKAVNVHYIQLMCNMLLIRNDLISLKALNRIRNLSFGASPNDLKPCIIHLRRLLEKYASETNVTMYGLSIFVKLMFHPMATSALFAKELYDLIFNNITPNEDNNFIWNIVDHLISYNFDAAAIFERFSLLLFLTEDSVRILMEYKIHERCCRTPALKLLCIMLDFVRYKECHCLEEKLEASVINQRDSLSPAELSLVIHALNKILQKKRIHNCSADEINSYKQMQFIVSQAFFEQMLPVPCVKYTTVLLSTYAKLIGEDIYWDKAACLHFEEDLSEKLSQVRSGSFQHDVYLLRDVVYIGELIMLCKAKLTDSNFNHLKAIVTVRNIHPNFLVQYLKLHPKVWGLCILLYVKVCFVNSELIPGCVENLEMTMAIPDLDETLQLQIIYIFYDVCQIHLQYYDPIIPHLFSALKSGNAHVRFVSTKLIIRLLNEEHLRLLDGQYFLFMTMLADEKAITAKNVELYVRETFVRKHPQTVARYFVPSIIHYNFCYSHPTISLSDADRRLLKKGCYTKRVRCDIYCCLYHFLPEDVKYNILNQIASELLDKMLKRILPRGREALEILEDALTIILYTIPKDAIGNKDINANYYATEVKYIEDDLLVTKFKGDEKVLTPHDTVIINVLIGILQLLYSRVNENSKISQNLLFTITILSRTFSSVVKQQLLEASSLLRPLFKKLRKFYNRRKEDFRYYMLTVNPVNLPVSMERNDIEFYFQEVSDFTMIAPSVFSSIGSR